jgi:hypothetical protein
MCSLPAVLCVLQDLFVKQLSRLHPNLQYSTLHTLWIMDLILDFVNVGRVDQVGFNTHCKDLYTAGLKWQILPLVNMARSNLSCNLTANNIKDILCLAHRAQDVQLVEACYKFTRPNFASIVLDASFAALSFENPPLWRDLQKAMLTTTTTDCLPDPPSK